MQFALVAERVEVAGFSRLPTAIHDRVWVRILVFGCRAAAKECGAITLTDTWARAPVLQQAS